MTQFQIRLFHEGQEVRVYDRGGLSKELWGSFRPATIVCRARQMFEPGAQWGYQVEFPDGGLGIFHADHIRALKPGTPGGPAIKAERAIGRTKTGKPTWNKASVVDLSEQAYELGTLDQGILDEFLPGVKMPR